MDQEIVLESIWVAVGFIVFVVLIWRKVGAALGSMLDERSEKISNELKEAAALRDDALEELQVYRRLHREAAAEAKTILQSAEAMRSVSLKQRNQSPCRGQTPRAAG